MERVRLVFVLYCVFHQKNVHANPPPPNDRIIGGKNTTIIDHPYMVSLQYFGNHMCGATILNTEWILTAAHCFGTTDPLMRFLTIRSGSSTHDRGGKLHSIEKIIKHENYTKTYDCDIALLKLKEPLIYGNLVKAIDVPEQDEDIPNDSDGIVIGWGKTQDGYLSEYLQVINLSILSRDDCYRLYGDVFTQNMICAHYHLGEKDSCNGDSGGPLIVDGKQFGIISWGPIKCSDPIYPGVYSYVSRFRNWIKRHTAI